MRSGGEVSRLQRSWIQRNAAGPESLLTHILCCRTFIFALGVSFLLLGWLVRAEVSRVGLWNVSEESIVWKPALCILGSFPSKLPSHCYHWTIMMILMLMMMVKLSFCPRMRTTSTLTRRESITTFTSLHMFSSRRCYDEENIREWECLHILKHLSTAEFLCSLPVWRRTSCQDCFFWPEFWSDFSHFSPPAGAALHACANLDFSPATICCHTFDHFLRLNIVCRLSLYLVFVCK